MDYNKTLKWSQVGQLLTSNVFLTLKVFYVTSKYVRRRKDGGRNG
ncbi:MAG: hypothetical protein AB8G22_24295 [Saprospiraceae bacterium]